MSSEAIAVVDFFSGCGGTSQGLREAGMRIIAGIDNDPDAAATYQLNFPEATFFETDVSTLPSSKIADLIAQDDVTLFAGCAPCQPFSRQKKDNGNVDSRKFLLLEFLKFILAINPNYVMVENVPGMQNIKKDDGPFKFFVESIESAGYLVTFGVLKAADFGVPQIRKRLVLLASRGHAVDLPSPTHGSGLIPFATVSEWIRDLPRQDAGVASTEDPEHVSMRLSDLNMRRIRATPEGGGRLDWTDPSLLLDCHKNYSGHTDVYGRLAWDKPASGLTTKCLSYSNGRFGHPTDDRALTIREAALLQTFPKTFKFTGSLTSKAKQIGNAVPPLMAKHAGQSIVRNFNQLRSLDSVGDDS
jgi:DNA (cytosine-5)-methyltransferase 1